MPVRNEASGRPSVGGSGSVRRPATTRQETGHNTSAVAECASVKSDRTKRPATRGGSHNNRRMTGQFCFGNTVRGNRQRSLEHSAHHAERDGYVAVTLPRDEPN